MDNKLKYIIVGSFSSLLALGVVSYVYNKKKISQKFGSNQLNLPLNAKNCVDFEKLDDNLLKEIYINFLKDQLQKFQPMIDEMETLARFLKQRSVEKGQDPREEEIYMTIMESPEIQKKLNKLEDEVYQSHKFDKEELTKIVKIKFDKDVEARKLLDKTAELLTAAASGVNLCTITPIPEKLNPVKSFEITQKCMMISNVQLQKEMINLIAKKGKIDFEDEETKKALNNIDITQLRERIFVEEGITGLQDPPTRVLRAAVYKYMNDLSNYGEKLMELEAKHQSCYKQIIENPQKIIDFQTIYNLNYTK